MKWKCKKLEINTAVISCGSGCQTASPCVKQNLSVTEKFQVPAVVTGKFQCIHASALQSHYRG